jgi:type IV secretion system protein VirB4
MSLTERDVNKLCQVRRNESHLAIAQGHREPDLSISHLVKPYMFATLKGELGVTFKVAGVASDTETGSKLNQHTRSWHGLMTRVMPPYAVLTTLHRHHMSCDLKGEFTHPFAKAMDEAYRQQFAEEALYTNDWYVTFIRKGKGIKKTGFWQSLFKKSSQQTLSQQFQQHMAASIRDFELMLPLFKRALADFGGVLLGEDGQEGNVSPLLQFLGLVINGGQSIPYRFSNKGYSLQTSGLSGGEDLLKTYPNGHLGHFLPRKRITFAERGTGLIQFHGNTPGSHQFAAVVSLKGYPKATHSVLLDVLLQLKSQYISTQSFVPLVSHVGTQKVKNKQVLLNQSEDDAISQQDALAQLRDDIASENASVGYHHHSMLVLGDSVEDVYRQVAEIETVLMENGIGMVREVLGLRPAFASLLPGNFHRAFRASLITSHNYCDLNSLHNYPHGFLDENYLGGAVTLAQTPSASAYYFNYHSRGSKQNPSAGHSLFFGGNNSGKTAAMMHTATQLQRYGGRLFVFDRDRCSNLVIWALDGHYTVLSPDHPETCRYNPFALNDSASNRAFLVDWFCTLCCLNDNAVLSPQTRVAAKRVVDYAYTHLATSERTLTNACAILPTEFEHFIALHRYLRETTLRDEGEYAYLFDNLEDHFQDGDVMGFDMTDFIGGDEQKPHPAFEPLSAYLFYRIEAPLKEGEPRLTSIYLDEFQQLLRQRYFRNRLKMWLPTLRKKNAHITMGTQSVATVIQSDLVAELTDNTVTKNFFANPDAKTEEYQALGCHQAHIDTIRVLDPKQHYMLSLVKGEGADIIRFPLAKMQDALAIYSANSVTIALAERLRKEYGNASENWLPAFHQQRKKG